MRERFFEQGARVNKKVKAMDRELSDSGISDPNEWRKAIDLETPLEGEEGFERHIAETRQTEARIEVKAGKIEDANWQRQLDTAFEQGNYSLIQTLQRVRPESIPNPEIIRNKLNELVVSRPSSWVEEIEKIRSVVNINIEADPTILSQEFGKLLEQFAQERGITDQLKTFKKATGFIPSPEQVQAKYAGIIKGKKSYEFEEKDLFEDLRELTGIKPDASLIYEVIDRGDIRRAKELSPLFGVEITSEMIQRAYEVSFEKNGSLNTVRMSEMGEKPNSVLVKKVYARIIEKHLNGWWNSINALEEATGIKPVFTSEQLRPIFEEYLQRGWYGLNDSISVEYFTALTGIKPPVDLVEKTALKIIDAGPYNIDQGRGIKQGIKRLRASTGVDFTIPESEIQERYQKAITDKKVHVISNLYGAFGIRPSVDKEVARQFMVGLMDETYHNLMPELEKVFGIKFKATRKEIKAKQDENLEKLNFDGLKKIKALTGKDIDREKLESAFVELFAKEATTPPHTRESHGGDWGINVKQRLQQFGVTVPQEVVLSIYETLVSNDTVYSDNIATIQQITGVPLPAGLAQRAYEKILSPDYVTSVSTGRGSSCLYRPSDTFAEIYKITDISPHVPTEKVQHFYRSRLEQADIQEVKTIIKMTGVQPICDPEDINNLYKQWILGGRENYVRSVKEVTGVELKLDEETLAHVSQQIEAGIEKVRSGNYGGGEENFDTNHFEYDLRAGLMAVTGIKPDMERWQSAYSEILVGDPNWVTKIEKIITATGIKPVFSPEQIQAKGKELLGKGALRSFERLQEYGQFIFTPEVVAKMYDALLATNRRYDEYDRKHYYNEDWVDRIKRFKETTGIAPSETQLAQIFSHISQDTHIEEIRGGYGYGVKETIKFFVENFQTEISAGLAKDIAISYLARWNFGGLNEFIEKVGVTPEFTDEDLLPHVNRLLEAKHLGHLAYLRQCLKLARLPATETVTQSAYQHFASQKDFGEESSESLKEFKLVFELTGTPANLPAEQTDRVYKTTNFAEWQKLNEILGALPSNEVVQYRYLQYFTGGYYDGLDKNNIEAIRTLTGQSPETETIRKALEHCASEGKIEKMSNIVKITGGKPDINPESGQKAYRKITKYFNYGSSTLVAAIDFLNDTFGIRPDSEIMYQLYSKTFLEPEFWKFLVKKFGKPDAVVVQRMYLAQLAVIERSIENFNYIGQFTGVKPDIKEMARIEKARGVKIEEQQIDARLQNLFQQELLRGNIEGVGKLDEQFDRQFRTEPADLQVLYTRVLMEEGKEHQRDTFRFLLDRTGVAPSPEIIQARYRELFAENFRLENIGAFQEMVDAPPSNEVVQEKYREVFHYYIAGGDRYFEQYTQLIQATGIRPQFDRDYALKLYEFCMTSGSEYHQKLGVIAQETGVAVDQDFIQKYLLDNPEFSSPVPLSISNDQLNKHFSNSQNTSLGEYKRIYQVFGCFDYYQDVLAQLEQDKSRGSKQQVIAVLAAMGLRDMQNEERYAATKEKLMAFVEEKSTPINKSLGEALAELAKNGDADLLSYLAATLRERTKPTKGIEDERGVLGFSPLQEVSLRTLFHVDNPVANEHLLALLSVSDIDPRVRSLLLKNLVTEKREFLPDNMRTWAEAELTDKKSKFPWEDLRYIQATNQIPSADLRRKSLGYLNEAFKNFLEYPNVHPSTIQKDYCPLVPDNIFLSLYEFTGGSVQLLEKFNGLYKATKASTEKDALLFGIINALSVNKETLGKVINRLDEIDLIVPGTAQELGTVLKTLSFLDTVERELGQSGEETLTILDSPVESLSSLNESLKQIAVQKIKEVLPHEGINADAIQSLWGRWGSLEPIFVYAGKMASNYHDGTLRLVAEMVANMDAPEYEGWKKWRYNPQDREVREQIGHLTEAQLEVWKGDHFAELGDIMIAATPSDKPKQISRFIEGSLREGHIYNSAIRASDRHKFIQDRLGAAYTAIAEHPNQRETILNGAIELLQADIEKIDAITRFSNLPKLEQVLTLFAEGKNVPVNAKIKNLIGFLAQFLPKEQFQEIERVYKEAEKSEASTIDMSRLIDSTTRGLLTAKMEEIKGKYEEVLQSNIFEQYGLNKEQLKNIGQFYQKRQELKALVDLYRVSALDVKRIATNRISDRVDKKGETLTKVIEGLKTYFKDNPTFVQDIENIHAVISQREDLGAKRRLAMIVTDSPQMLFQAGKYPIGCGSCQNYEGSPDWNMALAGYVADAHIKVAFMIDLNQLPDGLRNEIESKGFEEVKEIIPHQDLLEASIARAITKITRISESSEPTLFIEPTYSSINKGDLTMDKYFNIFLELMVSEPMGIRLTRGGGSETVRVPNSRNPSGQYEDCAAGNAGHAGMGILIDSYTMPARFIDKFTPVTDADRQLAERISGE